MVKHVYIHIPFCKYICTFCDFKRDIVTKYNVETYVDKIISELSGKYSTIYIGGGTPNVIEDKLLRKLLSKCQEHLDVDYEFTIECNPDSVTESQVDVMKECGVNRISIGVQTTNDKILKLVNRLHTIKDVEKAISLLYDRGIDNVSLDFIYNLPFLKLSDIDNAITLLNKFNIKHVSFYSLELKEGSIMTKKGEIKIDTDIEEEQMQYIEEKLLNTNYHRYEVGSWAIDSQYQSAHNKAYWMTKEWQAIGYGAHGFTNMNQYSFDGSIDNWVRKDNIISREDLYQQILMMGLRLVEGIDLSVEVNNDAYMHFKGKLKKVSVVNNRLLCDNVSLLFNSIENIF